MNQLYHLLKGCEDLIHILFILTIIDISSGLVRARIYQTWTSKLSIKGLWKKLSNYLLIILCAVVDFILERNQIILELKFTHLFSYLLILTECGSILENLEETKIVSFFKEKLEKVIRSLTKTPS